MKSYLRVVRRELYLIFTDVGVMLFFFVLPLFYPVVYTLIYNPEQVTDVETVIVDDSRSAQSRALVRSLEATPAVKVVGYAADMAEARRAWAEKKCYAIIRIPSDYGRNVGAGRQATISYYQDASLLLRYRQMLFSLTALQIDKTSSLTERNLTIRAGGLASAVGGLPVDTLQFALGDDTQGFASFIMPGIIVLILQQAMLMGIMMLYGTRRDRRRFGDAAAAWNDVPGASPISTLLGRATAYVLIMLPMAFYCTDIVPAIFSLPQAGQFSQYMPMITLMLVCVAFLGQTLQIFCRERETAMVLIVFTSVFFLFLSGLTWPRFAMHPFWRLVSDFVPGTLGVQGFVHIKSNGALLTDVSRFYLGLGGLTVLYFVTSLTILSLTRPRKAAVTATSQNSL